MKHFYSILSDINSSGQKTQAKEEIINWREYTPDDGTDIQYQNMQGNNTLVSKNVMETKNLDPSIIQALQGPSSL